MVEELETINTEICANEARIAELKAALDEKRAHWKQDGLLQIETMMADHEISRADLAAHFKIGFVPSLVPSGQEKKERKPRAVWTDKDTGQQYKGGKIPSWLAQRMGDLSMTLDEYHEHHMQKAA